MVVVGSSESLGKMEPPRAIARYRQWPPVKQFPKAETLASVAAMTAVAGSVTEAKSSRVALSHLEQLCLLFSSGEKWLVDCWPPLSVKALGLKPELFPLLIERQVW